METPLKLDQSAAASVLALGTPSNNHNGTLAQKQLCFDTLNPPPPPPPLASTALLSSSHALLPPLPPPPIHAAAAPFTPDAKKAACAADEDGSAPSESTTASAQKEKIAWTEEEDEILRRAVEQHNGRGWKLVAEQLPGRTHSQAAHRWQKVLDPKIKKGSWTLEEDEQLHQAVEEVGEGHWSRVAERVMNRNGKQCRERWRNQLSPQVDKRPWSAEEDADIIRLHKDLGSKWAEIAKHFPGRTENAVKNRWNAKLGRHAGGEVVVSSPLVPPGSAVRVRKLPRTPSSAAAAASSAASARDGPQPTLLSFDGVEHGMQAAPSSATKKRHHLMAALPPPPPPPPQHGTAQPPLSPDDPQQIDASQALLALRSSSAAIMASTPAAAAGLLSPPPPPTW